MLYLTAGLVLFFGVHVFTSWRPARAALIAKVGEGTYKGAYSLLSLAGFALIVMGMSRAPVVALWRAPQWGHHAAIWIMPVALILLAVSFIPCNFKRFTAHPLLWAVVLWALAHLLSNGALAGLLLFGGFGLYAFYAMWAQNWRGARPAQSRRALAGDVGAVIAGLLAYGLLLRFHGSLFGAALWP